MRNVTGIGERVGDGDMSGTIAERVKDILPEDVKRNYKSKKQSAGHRDTGSTEDPNITSTASEEAITIDPGNGAAESPILAVGQPARNKDNHY